MKDRTSLLRVPAVALAALLLVFSLAARAGEETKKNPAKPPADKPPSSPLSPEKYYQLVLERQALTIQSDKETIKILDAHKDNPKDAIPELKKHDEEFSKKLDALFQKYGVTAEEYYRSYRGTPVQDERSKYLAEHPEIRDQLAKNSKEIASLEKEVWKRLRPIWSEPKK